MLSYVARSLLNNPSSQDQSLGEKLQSDAPKRQKRASALENSERSPGRRAASARLELLCGARPQTWKNGPIRTNNQHYHDHYSWFFCTIGISIKKPPFI